ncbi:hypothetical protein Igag_0864 [Ignisphaera aggregans DSM 17230]|uniref:Permease n=1 Tax=Ignisphaera aggregans (strain DSM 17230 / JCM 13409 / AQ1.S1) TaxID=583356 RepID=E0STR5_IGNAA|nr:hypothetical protein Igag_0864 [Ignisphaera aggregans DSM 17230]
MDIELRRFAEILAREAMYRSFRFKTPLSTANRGGGIPRVSILASNIVGAVLLSILSIVITINVFRLIETGFDPSNAFKLFLTLITGFAVLLVLLSSATFTSTIMRENIIDILKTLPLRDIDILKIYLVALILYWGGLSAIFIYIPFIVGELIAIYSGILSVEIMLLTILIAILVLGTSYCLGIGLGAYSHRGRYRVSIRALSTSLWIVTAIAFSSIYYLFYNMLITIRAIESIAYSWGYLLPIVGILYSNTVERTIVSLIITVTIVLISIGIAIQNMNRLIYSEPIKAIHRKPAIERFELGIKPILIAAIVKDLKLIGREPRLLSAALITILIPLVMVIPSAISRVFEIGEIPFEGSIILSSILSIAIGFMGSMGIDHFYFSEGRGSVLLYYLPISRRMVMLSKALASSAIASPLTALITGIITFLITDSILSATAFGLTAMIITIAFSIIHSIITIRALPKEPCEWSETVFLEKHSI